MLNKIIALKGHGIHIECPTLLLSTNFTYPSLRLNFPGPCDKQAFINFLQKTNKVPELARLLENQNGKILIVEDQRVMRFIYEHSLSKYYPSILKENFIIAPNPDDACKWLKAHPEFTPDLVITDLHMPHMNGDKFIAEIRAGKCWFPAPLNRA
ncbi:MAG: response regulator [Candidatus Margulisiibacteriota bacterium]